MSCAAWLPKCETREQKLLDERNEAADASANRTHVDGCLVDAHRVAGVGRGCGGPHAARCASAVPPRRPSARGEKWGGIAIRYASAVIIVAVAVVLRVRLADSFGPLPPFVTLYPAVLLAASIGGGGPGIVATVLSALAADYWFLPPYGQFSITAPNDILALGIFTGSSLFLSVLAERLRRARWAEAISVAQEQQLEELSHLNEELSQQSEELSQQSEELSQQNEELQTQSEELSQQNEELQSQSEEIHALNAELTHREDLLQKLLDAARLSSAEQTVLQRHLCDSPGDVRPGRLRRDGIRAARQPSGGLRAGRAGAGGGEGRSHCPRRVPSSNWSSPKTRRPRWPTPRSAQTSR